VFLINIWTALFKKDTWKEKPSRPSCSKMPRIWKEKSAKMFCFHFTRLLDLLINLKVPRTPNSEKFSRLETFCSSKFDPATGVIFQLTILWIKCATMYIWISYFGLADTLSVQARMQNTYICHVPTDIATIGKEEARRMVYAGWLSVSTAVCIYMYIYIYMYI